MLRTLLHFNYKKKEYLLTEKVTPVMKTKQNKKPPCEFPKHNNFYFHPPSKSSHFQWFDIFSSNDSLASTTNFLGFKQY